MPKIGTYQRQVQMNSPKPDQVPEFNQMKEVASETNKQFGAIENYGNAVNKLEGMLLDRVLEHNQMQNEKDIADIDTNLRLQATKLLEDPTIDQNTGKPKGVLQRKLDQARNSTLDFINEFSTLKDSMLAQGSNDYQKEALRKSFDNHFQGMYDSVYKHEAKQMNDDYVMKVDANIKQRIMDAARIQNPEVLRESVFHLAAISATRDRKQGLGENAVQLNKDLISAELVKSSIGNMVEKDYNAAQRMFNDVSDLLDASSKKSIQDMIDGKSLNEKSKYTFYALRDKKLANGDYDFRAMQASIYAMDDIDQNQKEKLWDSVKARASEDMTITKSYEKASDDDFKNQVHKIKRSGGKMDDALKLVGAFGRDYEDKSIKEKAITKIFTKDIDSNPQVRLNLWERVQSGAATKEEIDRAYKNDLLSTPHWFQLREEIYLFQVMGISPEAKYINETIKNTALRSYSNPNDKAAFTLEAKDATKGKTKEEAQVIIKKLQENDPNTGIGGFFAKKLWRTQADKKKMRDEEIGQIYLDVGKDQTTQVMSAMGLGKDWTKEDFESWEKRFGGRGNTKIGSRVNEAIKALVAHKRKPTVENINKFLQNNP